MSNIFEIQDKTGREIHLSEERWKHIRVEHPEILNHEELKQILTKPDKITESDRDIKVGWYYLYNKQRKRFLKISVKYLNGEGYIITAHYTTKIE
jgi:hypothetical protein